MSLRAVTLATGVLLVVGACTFAPDLTRFTPCDAPGGCPSGTACLASENRCLPRCGEGEPCGEPDIDEDDAGSDAGPVDAGFTDAGFTDAGTPDAGTSDAGTTDAGASDAGPTDAGASDAGPTALSLESTVLAEGTETVPYTTQLQARGGTPPYVFAATDVLPAGFSLATDGRVSGTPTRAGDAFLSVEVTDQSNPVKRASGSLRLPVRPVLRMAGPAPLANTVPPTAPYTERLYATGGRPPYRFALLDGGTLPPGLVLADDGGVSGTPTQGGSQTLLVEVSDSDTPPQVATRALTVTSTNATGLLSITSTAVPDGRAGTEYGYTLKTTGGSGAFTWSITGGGLPPGVVLDTKSGLITGTPTRSDTFTFTVHVADLIGVDDRIYTLKVD